MADGSVPKAGDQRVLRVNQLDATQLDYEIINILRSQLRRAFQFFEHGVLSKIEPELNALLRLLVWKFSVYSRGSTVGQQMLNMKYSDKYSSQGTMSMVQKVGFGLIVIGGRYLQDRSTEIKLLCRRFGDFSIIWRCLYVGEKILQFASMINFLVFLQKGRYQSLLERLLGIHHVFEQRQSLRQVSFEFMTRELLWHGFAEFLFFLLPLINVHKLKNLIMRQFTRPALPSSPNVKVAFHQCSICSEPPTAPHQGACEHVFCYYCIKGNSMADPSFPCPLCGTPVGEAVHPVECTVALQVK
ncbi:peroxisome biogenesis factor 2 isoform X1 [Nematostella vectensis]|uniref:peroxisome biogenesis factor 2 isoform X2 n=1 Tax=Nematostella vectensis TaxID=45351 RepID=UPI0020777521|nr:peroxisome biogenesis factor 2 isoform X2 [Nematostella vectensis]XP_048581041.1 peroxisome biogenesis factor 2 isoform X1 [Nematostella vectensis]